MEKSTSMVTFLGFVVKEKKMNLFRHEHGKKKEKKKEFPRIID